MQIPFHIFVTDIVPDLVNATHACAQNRMGCTTSSPATLSTMNHTEYIVFLKIYMHIFREYRCALGLPGENSKMVSWKAL